MAKSKSIGPQEGDKAPDFTLPGDGGQTIRLKDFKGKTVVLYFYPKDDTSGCTREAIEFTAALKDFKKAGAVVIGVSKDTPKKHDAFKAKHRSLDFRDRRQGRNPQDLAQGQGAGSRR